VNFRNVRPGIVSECNFGFAAFLLAACACIGCAKPTTGVVTGAVTVDGQPAKSGSIAFFPTDGKGASAGAEIVDGRYTAKAPFGTSKVEIRVPKVVGQKKLYDTADSPVKPLMDESLPARYNDQTELTVDVKPGETQKDFALSTK
jgi:hypothetical protein